jgi:hypothetical protein
MRSCGIVHILEGGKHSTILPERHGASLIGLGDVPSWLPVLQDSGKTA